MLKALATLTGETTENLWNTIIQNIAATALTSVIVTTLLFVVFLVFVIFWAKRVIFSDRDQEDWEDGVMIVSGMMFFFVTILAVVGWIEQIPKIANPEFYAMQNIANHKLL